jgi:hypothetical protein
MIKKMKPKVYNAAIGLFIACTLASSIAVAQTPVPPAAPGAPAVQITAPVTISAPVAVNTDAMVAVNTSSVKSQLKKLKVQLQKLSVQTNTQVIAAINNINIDADVDAIAPQVNTIISNAMVHTTTITKANDADLVKNYSKTYSVDANDVLSIENKYGSVTVNTWTRNEFKVDVQIKVSAGSDDATSKLLNSVTISDAKNSSTVAFRTNIEDIKSSWFSALSGSGSRKIEINYVVYMPVKNDLVIDNRYGAITLPDLEGKITINSAYGSFKAGSIPNESVIRVKYGNANMGNLGSCTLQLSYGDLSISSVNTLVADVSYSPIKIGKLHSEGTINLRYGGGLQIGDLDRTVKSLVISSSYSNVDIGLSGDENADFAISTHYGDFNYGDHAVTITDKDRDDDRGFHPTKSYKGYIGKSGTGKTITISSNYGNVKFN